MVFRATSGFQKLEVLPKSKLEGEGWPCMLVFHPFMLYIETGVNWRWWATRFKHRLHPFSATGVRNFRYRKQVWEVSAGAASPFAVAPHVTCTCTITVQRILPTRKILLKPFRRRENYTLAVNFKLLFLIINLMIKIGITDGSELSQMQLTNSKYRLQSNQLKCTPHNELIIWIVNPVVVSREQYWIVSFYIEPSSRILRTAIVHFRLFWLMCRSISK